MKTQLVRVTRTIRQTYFIAVEGAPSKAAAVAQACAFVDECGERDALREVTPWAGSARDASDDVVLHATIDFVEGGR